MIVEAEDKGPDLNPHFLENTESSSNEEEPEKFWSVNEEPRRLSPHFFKREVDGSVRLRIRFTAEEAAMIEEAAAETPLLLYIHRVLGERARFHIGKAEEQRDIDNKKRR